jgi:two-component system KDP operon response regulator KdpE
VPRAEILIVEDHPTMREAMRLILENAGFDTREASDGKTALSMVRERPPDIMFLDLNIPGTSGEEGREFVLSLGADEYFTKPFPPTELLRTVERVLEGPPETSPAGS